MSYTVHDYLAMIGDPVRTGAYMRALRKMVTADSVVLDLGSGFGFFAVLAAKLGAKRVFAIEPNDAISLGPMLARANGVADRVTFFQGDSRQVTLPERANLLIEDVRGVLPLHAERIKVLRDARERLLTRDARYVALRDHLFAAPSKHPAAVAEDIAVIGADTYGIDLRALRPQVFDAARRIRLKAADLLLPRALLGTLELATVMEPNFEGTARWVPEAAVEIGGMTLSFDAELSEGEHFSAVSGPSPTVHGCLYLPLREPLRVAAGAELTLRFCGIQVGADYTWTWECAVADPSGVVHRTSRQSTLTAVALPHARLAALSELHRPSLGLDGRRARDTIAAADGMRTSKEIAAMLAASAELGLAGEAEALEWVQRLVPLLEGGAADQL